MHACASKLREESVRVLRMICWVRGQTEHISLTWSSIKFQVDQAWTAKPDNFTGEVTFGRSFRQMSGQILEEVQTLLNDKVEEPLSNVLLREAWNQLSTSPRSALVMGIAALESALKRLITTCIPEATWLVENIPSSPVEKLLVEYLPKLETPAKIHGKVFAPPRETIEGLKKAIALRNQIVHGLDSEAARDSVREALDYISDTIALLDGYSGYKWASKNISAEGSMALSEAVSKKE